MEILSYPIQKFVIIYINIKSSYSNFDYDSIFIAKKILFLSYTLTKLCLNFIVTS